MRRNLVLDPELCLCSRPKERDPAAERLPPTASDHMEPPKVPLTAANQEPGIHLTPRTPLAGQAPGGVTFIPTQCSPLIPVLLPQQRGNGPYAIYLHPSSLRSNVLARPQPTSLAVRSMTFEDKTGRSPSAPSAAKSRPASRESDGSPLTHKRQHSSSTAESSPSKAKRSDPNFKVQNVIHSWNQIFSFLGRHFSSCCRMSMLRHY